MATTQVTEPLRAEHRELKPRIDALGVAADELPDWSVEEARTRLGAVVAFLRGHLVPHARAEEAVLYPAVEDAMGAPGATATMQADHTEIVGRIDRLAAAVERIGPAWPEPGLVRTLVRELDGLEAILLLHFREEEEVLLPVLDRTLDATAAARLFERMGHEAHGS